MLLIYLQTHHILGLRKSHVDPVILTTQYLSACLLSLSPLPPAPSFRHAFACNCRPFLFSIYSLSFLYGIFGLKGSIDLSSAALSWNENGAKRKKSHYV